MASLQPGWDGQTAGRISPLPLFLRLSIPPTDSLFIPSSPSGTSHTSEELQSADFAALLWRENAV